MRLKQIDSCGRTNRTYRYDNNKEAYFCDI